MASRDMIKVAQSQIHPAAGAIYYESLGVSAPGNSIEIIMPYHEVYAHAFVLEGAGTDFLDVTIDSPLMIIAGTANWSAWNGTDPISLAITGFRLRSTAGVGALRVCVKTRP